ncbi:DNA-binding protein [Aromatoleum anaerobium]|uniref:Mucin-associated surface protein n=1 Tax=Aromatoleum anaerobium TaxID=182180 RepID=A0ABX1PUK6_9RHOO|nr:DNA-binding protein [Aromatoleum anaerobium]MCK0508578.1 DNA-binding protein [Aromatoleum anaerobium]
MAPGSLGTIHKLFQQWEAGQAQPERILALPPPLQRAMLDFFAQELTTARAALEARLSDTQTAANDLAAENERLAGQIQGLDESLANLRGENAALTGKIEQLDVDLACARNEAAEARRAAEAARTEFPKAHVRLENLPVLEQENMRLRRAVDTERTARTDAERLAATAEAKAAGLTDRLTDTQERHAHAVAGLERELREQKQRNVQLESDLLTIRTEARDLATRLAQTAGEIEGLRARAAVGGFARGSRSPPERPLNPGP